jgi:DNA-binding CsgD family transcriptional regulator/tetratricopeptide (TPR) repeat protein
MVFMAQRSRPQIAQIWPLVGRDHELETLGAALDDPTCHGVGLIGAAGAGKTRLASAVGDLAASRGMTVVTVRATETASEIPFAALTPLLLELGVHPEQSELPVHAIAEAFAAHRHVGRLVLLIDDAPNLDSSSRAVVDQLAGTRGAFLLLTVREGSSDPGPALNLWKNDHVRRMQIGPVAGTDLAALVRLVLNGPVDGASLQTLTDACQGNLLLLREYMLGLLEAGILTTQHGIWRLIGSLADSPRLLGLIDHRLHSVTTTERHVLELIALGEPLDAGPVSDMTPPEVVESLERSGFIESVLEKGAVHIRFTHPLYAEIVRAQLSPVRRGRLYKLLADALEHTGSLRPDQTLRVAVWRLEGGGGDTPLMVAGARVALHLTDFHLAARLARAAWEASGSVEVAILLSDSLDRLGHSEEVEKVIRDAYPTAETDQDIAALAVRHASALYRWPDRTEEADDLLIEASARVEDTSCRRLIDAQRCGLIVRSGDVARAIALLDPLLEDRSDAAYVQASLNVGIALSLAGRGDDAIRRLDELATALHALGVDLPPLWAATSTVTRVYALVETGRLSKARELVESRYQRALHGGHPSDIAWLGSFFAVVLVTQGHLQTAEPMLREASALFGEMGHPGERWGLAGVALAAGQMGQASVAANAVASLEAVNPSAWAMMDVYEYRGRAWAAVAAGDLAAARTTLWNVVTFATQGGQWASVAAALHDLVRIDEDPQAARQLEELESRVDGPLMSARASYARAVLAKDPILAADAADQFERCGALLFAAEAASLEEQCAIDAGLHRRAAEAGRSSTRLLAQCGQARTPPLASTGDAVRLSSREREIALMAVQGVTNRAIADKLVLSKRTVENHLQRVYTKCGVSGRAGLVSVLGLPTEELDPTS